MADSLLSTLTAGLGTAYGNITTGNGYSCTVGRVDYDFTSLESLEGLWPVVVPIILKFSTQDLSNSQQIVRADFGVFGFYKTSTYDDFKTLAARKELMEFATDIHKATVALYALQTAGTFAMTNFEIIGEINMEIFSYDSPSYIGGVHCTFPAQFRATFSER